MVRRLRQLQERGESGSIEKQGRVLDNRTTDGDDEAVRPLRGRHYRDIERHQCESMPELPCLPFPISDELFGFTPLARRAEHSLMRCVGQSVRFDGQIGGWHALLRYHVRATIGPTLLRPS